MTSAMLTCLILLQASASSLQSTAGGQARPSVAPSKPARADFKVAVWYRRDRPLETFQYQIYDVRKREYTPAVDHWLALMRSKYTNYFVAVRDVDLSREKGETELLKVGAVIKRDLLAAAGMAGVFLGEPATRSPIPRPGLPGRPEMFDQPSTLRPRGSGAIDLNPPGPSFPVPVPYPRPHP
jgi:hypothetical protein